jgi:ELWxxDGT repeat protein
VPGAAGSDPRGLVAVAGRLYFRVSLPEGVSELWKSDGTEAGTVRVAAVGAAPIADIPRHSANRPFAPNDYARGAALGDVFIFAGSDPAGSPSAGVELWRSDGTEAGTYRLKDVEPGPASSDPAWFQALDGKLYFAASDSAAGRELWVTDGTVAGTTRVADVVPGPQSSDPAWLTASGASLWFAGNSPLDGRELWKFTPDTRATTVVARRIFYHRSGRDLDSTAYAAVAPDKTPLLPGQRATLANVTSYDRGINGVILEFTHIHPGLPSASDFELHVAHGLTWTRPPIVPAVNIRRMGDSGRRAYLTLPDGMVKNTWLRVTLKANANTGLAAPDVFYIGNLVGDAGGAGAPIVNVADLARTRARIGSTRLSDLALADFNRDGRVDPRDLLIVRQNLGHRLPLINAPGPNTTAPPPTFRPTRRGVLALIPERSI